MFAYVGAIVGRCWGYVGASWGYVGRSCAMLVQKPVECHRAKKHCKLQGFLSTRAPHREVRGRGQTMLAHLLAYVGLSCGQCGLSLELCWPSLGAMLAYLEGYVGRSWGLCRPILRPMLAHVDPCGAKRSEKREQQKNTVKRRIFWGSAAYLGAMLAHLGGYVGPSWGYVGPSWSYVGPSWGYVGPSWGPCWPILGAMLARVRPSWAIRSENRPKMGRAQNTVKRGSFWRGGVVGSRGCGPSLLRRGENRLRQCHGQGAPGRIYEAYAWQPGAGQSRPVSPSWCRWCRWCCRCRCLVLVLCVCVW